MGQIRVAAFLIIAILFFSGVIVFFLDKVGVMQAADYLPFLEEKNLPVISDENYPTEVEKMKFQKWEEKLLEREENLIKQEEELKKNTDSVKEKEIEINEMKKSIEQERKKLAMLTKDWNDRKKKIQDMAEKVSNMPPEKAKEMMVNWTDFDIIEVLRQMDKSAADAGRPSITPYLLTLFDPERRAEITRKMLLPPMEEESSEEEPF